ncbi:MAG TPA: ATP12 family protein [Stellaceae bacterium]|nr:ATP12 family protein [Stellaceae bacterium]
MKRGYQRVTSGPVTGGWGIALDDRPLRTPGKASLVVPSAPLAAAIAAEWEAQKDEVRPQSMPLFRLAATAVDRTATLRDRVVTEIAAYAATDLVCHRADRPPALAARQRTVWQPLIDWATARYDAALRVTAGVIPTSQPATVLKAFAAAVAAQDDFRLTALHTLTGACGSLVIALAVLEGRLSADEAFAAAQLDETFQIEAWGEDGEAAARRLAVAADIAAAARFLELLAA